jgi:hypothetical protein
MDKKESVTMEKVINILILILAMTGLYFTTYVNYLLFHTLVEGFSIVVGVSIFMIAWNSKKYIRNAYLLFIGIAYLFIALLDLLHTLSYKGMPIFTDYDYYANQLWIGARYMESITLALAFVFLKEKRTLNSNVLFFVYTMVTALVVASVFYWKIFPVCFVEGAGLTPFKKISEYVICGILGISVVLLVKNKQRFEKNVYLMLISSIICTIVSELAFTVYTSNYGPANLIGHYFKVFSYFFIYKAILTTGIEKPFKLIFWELDSTINSLNQEVRTRKQIQDENEELIEKLTRAAEEIKTLQGILPLCTFCKKVRDENGRWEPVDVYIYEHSQADISHGICPDCMAEHYPGVNVTKKPSGGGTDR